MLEEYPLRLEDIRLFIKATKQFLTHSDTSPIVHQGTRLCIPGGEQIVSRVNNNPKIIHKGHPTVRCQWPFGNSTFPSDVCVVLTEEESFQSCGKMTVPELIEELGRFCAPPLIQNDITLQWLESFVEGEHSFGAAYAWAWSTIPNLECVSGHKSGDPDVPMASLSRFDSDLMMIQAEGYHSWLGSANDLGLSATEQGQFIHHVSKIKPRRIWDLCANRIIPFAWIYKTSRFGQEFDPETCSECSTRNFWAVSHSWTSDMEGVWSPVNSYQWPIPLPRGISLEQVRQQLLQRGGRYCWLDVVCLRQPLSGLPERTSLENVKSLEIQGACKRVAGAECPPLEDVEHRRLEEWKVDVPTIGNIYQHCEKIPIYFNGLGLPFKPEFIEKGDPRDPLAMPYKIDSVRHWLNRAWTFQEVPISLERMIIGSPAIEANHNFLCEEFLPGLLVWYRRMLMHIYQKYDIGPLITEMVRRSASNQLDRVAGVMYQLGQGDPGIRFPIYDPSETVDKAWQRYVRNWAKLTGTHTVADLSLLFGFPHPSARDWFPSWRQLEKYPDRSLKEEQGAWSDTETFRGVLLPRGPFGICTRCILRRKVSIATPGGDSSLDMPRGFQYGLEMRPNDNGVDGGNDTVLTLPCHVSEEYFQDPIPDGDYVSLFPDNDYDWQVGTEFRPVVLCGVFNPMLEVGGTNNNGGMKHTASIQLHKVATIHTSADDDCWDNLWCHNWDWAEDTEIWLR